MSQFLSSSHSLEKDGTYGIIRLINTNATLKATLTSFNRKGEILGVFYKEFPGEHFIDQPSYRLSYDGKVAIFETFVKSTTPQLNKIHILTINEGNFDFCYTGAKIHKVNISRDNQTIHLHLTIPDLTKDTPTSVVKSKTIVLDESLTKIKEIYRNTDVRSTQERKDKMTDIHCIHPEQIQENGELINPLDMIYFKSEHSYLNTLHYNLILAIPKKAVIINYNIQEFRNMQHSNKRRVGMMAFELEVENDRKLYVLVYTVTSAGVIRAHGVIQGPQEDKLFGMALGQDVVDDKDVQRVFISGGQTSYVFTLNHTTLDIEIPPSEGLTLMSYKDFIRGDHLKVKDTKDNTASWREELATMETTKQEPKPFVEDEIKSQVPYIKTEFDLVLEERLEEIAKELFSIDQQINTLKVLQEHLANEKTTILHLQVLRQKTNV